MEDMKKYLEELYDERRNLTNSLVSAESALERISIVLGVKLATAYQEFSNLYGGEDLDPIRTLQCVMEQFFKQRNYVEKKELELLYNAREIGRVDQIVNPQPDAAE